ncbi:MAG: glycosyltransferase family 39 protein [Leptospiraceae bacterium]|nr:glycosyltransferase family 39 protein [Leptospiraceae bacterium]
MISHFQKLVLIILGLNSIKLIYALNLGLVPDEVYYWEWSRNIDFSFYDQGPGVALYIRLFTSILGNNLFSLKLAAIVASFLCSILLLLSGRLLSFSETQLNWIAIFTQFIPGFWGGSVLIMHDSPLILFWSLGVFSVLKFLKDRNSVWIYVLFISIALGALSKHSMVFFALSLVIWLVTSKDEWSLLKNIHFYLGLVLAFIIISPVLYWNLKHDWENIDAILNLRSSGSVNSKGGSTGKLFIGQLLSISPIWFLSFFAYAIYTAKRIYKKEISIAMISSNSMNWFLVINFLTLPIFFLFMSIRKDTQANWVFPAYISGILIFTRAIGSTTNFHVQYYKYLRYGLPLALLFILYSMFSINIDKLTGQRLEPYFVLGYRSVGFDSVTEKVLELQKEIDKSATIITNKYQDAAILSWYIPEQPRIQSLNILQKNQYNHWLNLEQGKNYLLVYIEEKTCEKSFVFFQPYLNLMFEEVKEYPEKEIVDGNSIIKRYQVWHLKNYQRGWSSSVRKFLHEELATTLLPTLANEKTHSGSSKEGEMLGFQLLQNYYSRGGEIECKPLKK